MISGSEPEEMEGNIESTLKSSTSYFIHIVDCYRQKLSMVITHSIHAISKENLLVLVNVVNADKLRPIRCQDSFACYFSWILFGIQGIILWGNFSGCSLIHTGLASVPLLTSPPPPILSPTRTLSTPLIQNFVFNRNYQR